MRTHTRKPRSIVALVTIVALSVAAPLGAEEPDDYSNPAYAQSDLDSMSRSLGRQRAQATSPEYHQALLGTAAESWLSGVGRQVNDARHGRVYAGAGQLIPGGSVGDPERYHAVGSRRVQFLSRTGAKLSGRIWGTEAPGPRPGVVITTGSIQGTEHMYWWAARDLVARGYVVMTWDVQGQGESETFGHAPGDPSPAFDGFPSQQAGNFVQGTIDALRFFLSTPEDPYVPGGWDDDDVAAATAGSDGAEQIDWVNPGWGVLDRDNLGIAGHSLGASAVTTIQQCSDEAQVWTELAVCEGQSFPIRAVVGWDSLSTGVTPVVPGMNQRADGYFFNPTPSFTAPDPNASLGTFDLWRDAGLDTYTVVIRGGTHLEWTEIPYILPATEYGTSLATFYTGAWFDRYLHPDAAAREQALEDLLEGPKADPDDPWSADHFSVRFHSALSLLVPPSVPAAPAGRDGLMRIPLAERVEHIDLRAYAGRSAVGDWEGANAG